MSDMTPHGKLLSSIYDKLDDALYQRGAARYRLDTQNLWRIEKWQLRRRIKKLDKRIEFYKKAVIVSKRRMEDSAPSR